MQPTEADLRYMERALELALTGRGRVAPNPMVGAVIVRDGRIIGEGFHAAFGAAHAEVQALGDAHRRGADARGAAVYVNLEPCAHYGKTPPCAAALIGAGVRRVVAATRDPTWADYPPTSADGADPAGPRPGFEVLEQAGVATELGPCSEQAIALNASFFKRSRTGLPLVTAKWAMSVDGKIAARDRSSRWISCPQSRQIVHELRGASDAIIVGSHTVQLDDPLLTCREVEPCRTAARVVLCCSMAPGADSNLVRTAGQAPVILAHRQGQPLDGALELRERGCELLPLPPSSGDPALVDVRALLRELGERGACDVLVEGGAAVLGSFFDEGLVDRVLVFIAPFVIGGDGAVTPVGGRGVASIKSAIPLPGPVSPWGDRHPQLPCIGTTFRLVGRDVLLEGWSTDPRRWVPGAEGCESPDAC